MTVVNCSVLMRYQVLLVLCKATNVPICEFLQKISSHFNYRLEWSLYDDFTGISICVLAYILSIMH
jgi:hypothetical protein